MLPNSVAVCPETQISSWRNRPLSGRRLVSLFFLPFSSRDLEMKKIRQGCARGQIVCGVVGKHGEKTSASRARTELCGVAQIANATLRESLRQEGAGLALSPSLSLPLSFSLLLSLSGRDGADEAEERARGVRESGQAGGGRGAGISPRGSVTNSIRRGRGEETSQFRGMKDERGRTGRNGNEGERVRGGPGTTRPYPAPPNHARYSFSIKRVGFCF